MVQKGLYPLESLQKRGMVTKIMGWFGAAVKQDTKARRFGLKLLDHVNHPFCTGSGQGAAGEENGIAPAR